ncbi:NAD-P-binding protein [Rhizoctonia solani]|uniref:NAD-P-binding protein n=1 Tax=Rhizoctonia solani TaxID=456999 RepID=A0A8H7I731_9AGAM|nr:NAD-P-binding protein [Rhizoctonia solani]
MNEGDTSTGPSFELGKPIWGIGLALVLRSETNSVRQGDIIYVPTYQYNILSADTPLRVIKPDPEVPLSAYLTVLGMPGQTAFYGLELIGAPKSGETIYVSAGAGAVGSLVAQLAKAKGLKVIASAGSDEKTDRVEDVLAREGPIDIYWDHIGGPQLEYAEPSSAFNNAPPYHVKNLAEILYKRLRFLNTLTPLVKNGKILWKEQAFSGIQSVNEAIVAALTGNNTGK